ncbi:PorT family protein [Flavihumibacter sp. R14]|nr:PorT family protein [Flavihumibacter soli]
MKKYLLIAGLLICGSTSNAQVLISIILGDELNTGKIEFGLAGGLNFSDIRNLAGAEELAGFNLGFYFDIKVFKNPSWMLNTGVIVKSPMGADDLPLYSLNDEHLDSSFAGGSVTRKLRYFNVPVLMKYTLKNNFFVKGGIQLGLRSKVFDEFTKSVNDKDDLKYKLNIKDQFHPLDAGASFGIGYRLMKGNGMNLDLQYYYGLIDIVIDDSSPGQYNRVLYLTAGIPIGKNAAKKKADQGQ